MKGKKKMDVSELHLEVLRGSFPEEQDEEVAKDELHHEVCASRSPLHDLHHEV